VVVPPKNYLLENPEIQIGTHVAAPTDSVDILPTVIDVAGVWPKGKSLQDFIPYSAGVTLRPLLSDPKGYVRAFAVSQYQSHFNKGYRGRLANWYGYALRSEHYRFVVYAKRDATGMLKRNKPLLAKKQLFHYKKPGELETHNVFNSPEHAPAREAFLKLWESYYGRDWVGAIGVKPFDHGDGVVVSMSTFAPPSLKLDAQFQMMAVPGRPAVSKNAKRKLCYERRYCKWKWGKCIPADSSIPLLYPGICILDIF